MTDWGGLKDPTCTSVGFSLGSLSREGRIWRKGTKEGIWRKGIWRKREYEGKGQSFMQSPGSRYFAMPGKLLRRATNVT